MPMLQTSSAVATPRNIELQWALVRLFVRSVAMGVLPPQSLHAPAPQAVAALLKTLGRSGLLRLAVVNLAPLLRQAPAELDAETARRMTIELEKVNDALDESPSPATEWAALRGTLGDTLLAALVGVSDASLRRYAGGQRETPQKVAERLHWLALVVGDLAGSYNAFGIRRWFERPRQQLAGRSPRTTLGPDWSVDDAQTAQVKSLAEALVGASPLAA
jgi:hypothetical protein